MMVYYAIYMVLFGLAVYGVASMLNNSFFNKAPVPRYGAWIMSAVMFCLSFVGLFLAKLISYKLLSDSLGMTLTPNLVFDSGSAFVLSYFFFTTLNKREKRSVVA